MKKNIKYLVMAAVALLSMSACTNEMDEQNAANGGELQPVQFQMVTTRTVTDAVSRVTSWKVGDAIGIFALPAGTTDIANAKAANAKYVLGSDDVWKAEKGSEIYPEEALDYYAYYPYQEGVTNPSTINISAKADQSMANGDDYGASDVLAGQTKNVAAGQGNVTLIFKHMFAMVEVKVEGDKVAKQPAKVELKGVKLDAVLDIMAATPAATVKTDAEAKDIPMFYLAREGNAEAQVQPFSFRAVVPEQEIAGNTPLVAIYAPDADNKTYTMQHADAVPYKAGVFRQLNVNIGSSKVSLTIPAGDLTISPWEPSDAIEGEGGEVKKDLVTIPLANVELGTITTAANDAAIPATQANWFARLNSGTSTFAIISDATYNKSIKIDYKVEQSWYSNFIGFYNPNTENIVEGKEYTLSFYAKTTGTTGGANEPQIWVYIKLKKENKFCGISGVTTSTILANSKTMKNFNITNEWALYETTFTFAVLGDKSGIGGGSASTTATEWADITNKDYFIGFAPMKIAGEYYIANVKLEEAQ